MTRYVWLVCFFQLQICALDIEKEFNEYTDEETYVVLLYNDPFNKRNYVASCLMEVFSWYFLHRLLQLLLLFTKHAFFIYNNIGTKR